MKLLSLRLLPAGLAVVMSLGFLVPMGAGSPAISQASAKEASTPAVKEMTYGHVYLLRGLGNVWSRGIDKLKGKLDAQGVRTSLSNHRHWKEIVDEATEKYRADKSFGPIILIGHSLGADASVLIARKLGENNVPVRLMVSFDRVAEVGPVSANVEQVLNFYKGSSWGKEMVPSKYFKGKMENVDLRDNHDIGHLNIDQNPELQTRVIDLVMETLKQKGARSARN